MDQSNATAPQISGFAPTSYRYENGFEIIDGQWRQYRGENDHGKEMQVGNTIYNDVSPDCIESFCEDCQKRVSTGLSYR